MPSLRAPPPTPSPRRRAGGRGGPRRAHPDAASASTSPSATARWAGVIALFVYPSTLAERARSTADDSCAPSPPRPPRLTSRPPGARAWHAATAERPKPGRRRRPRPARSRTNRRPEQPGPPPRPPPPARPRPHPLASRATPRPPTGIPQRPEPPRANRAPRSPPGRPFRRRRERGRAHPAAAPPARSGTSTPRSRTCQSPPRPRRRPRRTTAHVVGGDGTVSARLPSPAAIPADVANHTRVPASSAGDRTTRPTPWTPARTAAPARRSTTSRSRTAGPAARPARRSPRQPSSPPPRARADDRRRRIRLDQGRAHVRSRCRGTGG